MSTIELAPDDLHRPETARPINLKRMASRRTVELIDRAAKLDSLLDQITKLRKVKR